MTPTDGMTTSTAVDWALRIITVGVSAVVYLLERDHKQRAEAIASKFRQQTKDLETLRRDMLERFDRAGKVASDVGTRLQAQFDKLDVAIQNEHAKRRADVDRLNVDLGKLQLDQARHGEQLRTLWHGHPPREHGDVT